MSELFAEADAAERAPVTARRSIGRLDDAIRVNTPNYDYFYLCPELRRKRMIPVVTRVRAKSIEEFGELVHHSGEEYIYVLEGRVEVHTEFYDPSCSRPASPSTSTAPWATPTSRPKGCEEAVLLGVCSSADDQLMESLMTLHDDESPAQPKALRRVSAKR